MLMNKQSGAVSIILAVVFALLFIGSGIFAFWAFGERQDYKNNVDKKITGAVEIAVQESNTAKDNEFLEKEKLPNRTYTSSATFGSLSFDYPKTWSVYSGSTSEGVLQLYLNPSVVPPVISGQAYALKIEISDIDYTDSIRRLDPNIKTGAVTAAAYRPEKVPSVLGLKAVGLFENKFQGEAVYLPLRDKTMVISTLSQQFFGDFETTILPTLTFNP